MSDSDLEAGWLVVDAMNVIGSRPDGWWHDRPGATRDFVARLGTLAEVRSGPTTVVIDGSPLADLPPGEHGAVTVRYGGGGPDAADDRIVELLERRPGGETTVVTADRDLRRRAAEHGAAVTGPTSLLSRLDEVAPRE